MRTMRQTRQLGRPSRRGVDRNVQCVGKERRLVESPLAQGRGSKRPRRILLIIPRPSRPSRRGVDRNHCQALPDALAKGRPSRRGVDRNPLSIGQQFGRLVSPLAQGRGSKRQRLELDGARDTSPLAQGRGSKLLISRQGDGAPQVAPRAGAWIETGCVGELTSMARGRPSRRGVDRNLMCPDGWETVFRVAPRAGAWIETWQPSSVRLGKQRRPSRRGVDRNCGSAAMLLAAPSRPSRRGVDRNTARAMTMEQMLVAPRAGGGSKPVVALSEDVIA